MIFHYTTNLVRLQPFNLLFGLISTSILETNLETSMTEKAQKKFHAPQIALGAFTRKYSFNSLKAHKKETNHEDWSLFLEAPPGSPPSAALRRGFRPGFHCACGTWCQSNERGVPPTQKRTLLGAFALARLDKKDATNLYNHKEIDNHYFRYK